MVATSTLAAGVNTPAETVIIPETSYPGPNGEDYPVATYKNMAGRAGRVGFTARGKSILIALSTVEQDTLFRRYVKGNPEEIKTTFDPKDFDSWMIRLLAQAKEVTRSEVLTLLFNTYAGYLKNRKSPEWKGQVEKQLDELLVLLVNSGLLLLETDTYRLTDLGKACGSTHFKLRSSLRLVDSLARAHSGPITTAKLLALVHTVRESDEYFFPMNRKHGGESWISEAGQSWGQNIIDVLREHQSDNLTFQLRCKKMAVLSDWLDGHAMSVIEGRYSTNNYQRVGAGNIRQLADFARFQLGAAVNIAKAALGENAPVEDEIKQILTRLELGIPEEALALLAIPIRVQRGVYLELFNNGVKTPDDIRALKKRDVTKMVGKYLAAKIQNALTELD